MAEQEGARRRLRGFESVGDMIRSLAVVLGAVLVILLITLRPHPDPVKVVDATEARQAAAAVSTFKAADPAHPPSAWRLTSARFTPAAVSPSGFSVWHLGWVTKGRRYAALEQSDGPADPLLESVLTAPVDAGPGTGAFAGWERWTGQPSSWQAYVKTTGSTTLVLFGSATDAELASLAGSLQPSS